MAFAPSSTYFDRGGDGTIIGSFCEKDAGHFFEFSSNDEMVLAPPAHGGRNMEFPHKVWVGGGGICGDQGWRAAKVGKTVVHIVTDEGEYGRAVIEKWHIKQHRLYPKPENIL